jgi:repressor LexA
MKDGRDLSKQQARIYTRLRQAQLEHGTLPSLADLARDLKLHYTTLRQHLRALEQKGYLELRTRGTGRSPLVALLGLPSGIPVVGDIPAGPLSEAVEMADGFLELPFRENLFALRVQGDSMADLIQHGDLVLLEKGAVPRSGEICAVRVDGSDVTLKYLDWHEPAARKRILRPHNPSFPTVEVDAEEFHVEGVYRGLLRGSIINTFLRDN